MVSELMLLCHIGKLQLYPSTLNVFPDCYIKICMRVGSAFTASHPARVPCLDAFVKRLYGLVDCEFSDNRCIQYKYKQTERSNFSKPLIKASHAHIIVTFNMLGNRE